MLAAALVVTIRVYDLYGLSSETRQEALAVAADALDHAGVEAIIVDCSARPAATPCKTGLADGELILRIHRLPKDGAHVLGDAIVRGGSGPNTIATVYAAAIAERARRDRHAAWRRIVGRVAAHELGHLLLGTNAHATHGLMRRRGTSAHGAGRLGLHDRGRREHPAPGCSRGAPPLLARATP